MTSYSNKRCCTSDDEANVLPIKIPKTATIESTISQLENLNDHCLLLIVSYLAPMDLINLKQTSRRFVSIVHETFQKKRMFSCIDDKAESVDKEHLPIVMQNMGCYIRSIYWTNIRESQLKYLSKYCENALRLKLISPSLSGRCISTEKSFFKNIRTLTLISCSSLYDNSMVTIVNSSHLRTLRILHCPNIQGKFLYQWKSCRLSTLQIYGYCPVRNTFFSACETGKLITLKTLSLDCDELETDKIEKLRSLRNLQRVSFTKVDNEMLKWLHVSLSEYIPHIEGLKILTKRQEDGPTSIPELVSSFARLKKFSHSLMTWESLQMICREREIRKQPLIEFGVPPGMFNDSQQMEFVVANKHIMKLTLLNKLW